MHRPPELVAAGLLENIRAWSAARSGSFQTWIFFGAVIALALVVFWWALVFRKQPRHRHHHSHSRPAGHSDEAAKPGGFFSHSRRRHRRHKHRPVNPTLAETGGLPAPRDSQTPPKSHL